MSYITTVTGRHFDPMEPEKQEIDIIDIAHALSLICRANGHFRHFYSVAQHCIACAEEAIERGYSWEVILGCLLHDASEAYLCDVTRPVKAQLPQYLAAEDRLQGVIWRRFIGRELTDAEKDQIFEIDDDILSMEFHLLMPEDLNEDYRKLKGSYTCDCLDPQEVRTRFIQMATLDITVERLLENSDRLKYLISELEAYYESVKWRRDFENDEAGLLPKNLKRGVLSEDGIYDLLEEYGEVSK